jgi:Skp family chaperone for outer membrane proteins
MPTTTIDARLEAIGRRIDRLQDRARSGAVAAKPRLQHHVDALRRKERATRSAAPDRFEQCYGELATRLDVAERSLAVDAEQERARFAAAVDAELRSLDSYVDRLQQDASTQSGGARRQADAAIAELRTRRLELGNELMRLRHCAGDSWHAERTRVAVEREELERRADELSAKLH